MAVNRGIDISRYAFRQEEPLILDTNIWLMLYGPSVPRARNVQAYSAAFARMLAMKVPIHIDALVFSEFVNRFARLEHGFCLNANPALPSDFKEFRNHAEFRSVAKRIRDSSHYLIKFCSRVETGFSELALGDICDEFGNGSHDFNDQVLATLCRAKNYGLVTDDKDFRYPGVKILTANPRLLQ